MDQDEELCLGGLVLGDRFVGMEGDVICRLVLLVPDLWMGMSWVS